LGDIANKQGRIAGSTIGGTPRIFPGIVGAQSFRLFDLEVAATGIGEQEAREAGYTPVSAIVWGNAIADVMPNPQRLGLKLVADRSTGMLLGAQAVGKGGVVGRINALSVALWAGLSLDEIYDLDLAYAPPYSGAWDIIHNTARVLQKKM
jgi:NADPH-dependent 2,4-dienoyl-CoA reductase/sulfur reductase-like enzyme